MNLLRLPTFQTSPRCVASAQSGVGDCFHLLSPLNKIRIAVVKPVFTAAAYNAYPEKSFYGFYKKHSNVPEKTIVKTDLNLLNTSVNKDAWGYSYGLYQFVQSKVAKDAGILVGNNTSILTDIDVNDGKLLYSNETRRFDVVILGFTEYVTAGEYSNYNWFVEKGGLLILLSACNFLAEVSYNSATNKVRLVKGHGWEFNGTAAWKGPFHRWYVENTNWIGSNYALFHTEGYGIDGAIASTNHSLAVLMRKAFGNKTLFSSYNPHEENAVTNSSDSVIAFWQVNHLKRHDLIVAAYEHDYRRGMVIHTGVFGTDIIATDKELQFLLLASIGLSYSTQSKITGATTIPPFSSSPSQSAAPTDKHSTSHSLSERKVQTPNRISAMTTATGRLNGEAYDRETIMRSTEKADTPILAGYTILQNYIRPNTVLESKTPVYAAGIVVEVENKWLT